jgi:hypothetical protein
MVCRCRGAETQNGSLAVPVSRSLPLSLSPSLPLLLVLHPLSLYLSHFFSFIPFLSIYMYIYVYIQADFAVHCPQTVSLLESIDSPSALMRDTPFSFAFFSTLHPASSIAAHTGPCNLRIRCHLPLLVPGDAMQPAGGEEVGCGMEVGPVKVAWKEGEPVFFDDCFQHRVWNHTHSQRVLLLFDLW